MKRFLGLAAAALMLVLVAPSAFAVRIRVVDAPPVDCSAAAPCNITDPTDTYALEFMSATTASCRSAASLADLSGFTWCIVLNNISGQSLTSLNFTFVVPEQGLGDDYSTVTCDGVPSTIQDSSCPEAPLQVGKIIAAMFSANPGVPNGTDAYLFVDFANNPGAVTATFVPEPGELGLFGLGLLFIGAGYGWDRRRRGRRIKPTA